MAFTIPHMTASAETNKSNINATACDNSSTQVLTTYQPSVATSEQIFFNYYVDGLYGKDCIARIANYVTANKLKVSFVDLNCACLGSCEPPLAPNPGALAWYQAQLLGLNNPTSVLTYFQTYTVFIVITSLIVTLGLVGQYVIKINRVKIITSNIRHILPSYWCICRDFSFHFFIITVFSLAPNCPLRIV